MFQVLERALGVCHSPRGIHAGLYDLREVQATFGTLASWDLVGEHVSEDVQATSCTLANWELVGQRVF